MNKKKPYRTLVLVEQKEVVKEEKTNSGLILLTSNFNLFNFGDDETKVDDMIRQKRQNMAMVISCGDDCSFVKDGDNIIYKKGAEIAYLEDNKPIIEEDDILVIENGNSKTPNPNCLIVKITKESRDALFSKKIKKDNGEEIELLIDMPPRDKTDGNVTQYFVTTGVVLSVGANIKNIKDGDLAILDYLVDNDEGIIVGYDGEDKLICVNAVTTRHETNNIEYQNRRSKRDQIVWSKGDYKTFSSVIGVIRNKELIAMDPYVFLNHKSNIVNVKTRSGIEYKQAQKSITRSILAVSDNSSISLNINKGEDVLMFFQDTFDIVLGDKKISAVNDIDIIATVL